MFRLAALISLGSLSAYAQFHSPEEFRLEVTGSGWRTAVDGTLQSGIVPVGLRTDLNLRDTWTFHGTLVWKPAQRHRLLVEGAPFHLDGVNVLNRTIQYFGSTFTYSDVINSDSRFTYLYAGYQYDVISRDYGHLGFNLGGAYLDAEGAIASQNIGISATRREQFGAPLIGAEFRAFPVRAVRAITISGEAKGAPLGPFGYFTEARIQAGYMVRLLTVLAGWGVLDADVHEDRAVNPAGVAPRISGPIVSVQFRIR